MKKTMTVVSIEFYSLTSNYGTYTFKDEEGNQFLWWTKSDKAYEELEKGTTKEFTFKTGDSWECSLGNRTSIKNVRWN